MALYTREVETDVVNRILENPRFPEITRMIARYFKDSIAGPFAGQNAMWDTLRLFGSTADTSHLANPQEGVEAMTQIVNMQKTLPHAMDIQMIQNALIDMLYDIKAGIRTQTPTTELATRQLTQTMIENMTKGSSAQPLIPQITLEQLAEGYAAFTGASLELGKQFSDLVKNFILGFIAIAQEQGLTNDDISRSIDQ